MTFRQLLGYAAVAFVLWWMIEQPASAAHVVHGMGTFLVKVADGLSQFFTKI